MKTNMSEQATAERAAGVVRVIHMALPGRLRPQVLCGNRSNRRLASTWRSEVSCKLCATLLTRMGR